VITATNGTLARAELAHAATHRLKARANFQYSDAQYSVEFTTEAGLLRCLDTMMSFPRKSATPRLHLWAEGYKPRGPEWPPSNLRFDFDREHEVAAAVLLVLDRDGDIHQWMTLGDAGRDDVFLTHDSWSPKERRFPPESFITVPQLRAAVAEWAFGDVFPPPAVRWRVASEDEVGWL